MLSVSIITNCRRVVFFGMFFLIFSKVSAQENSPYSRYGLGDLLPSQNIVNRGMGGVVAAYGDVQAINFVNPASYSRLKVTTFDVGIDYTNHTLKSINPINKFSSAYLIPSYLQIGIPLSSPSSKNGHWGMNIGLRPLTRINYKLDKTTRLPGIDSVAYLYQGNGGSYQAYLGTGFGNNHISLGFNVGYLFGSKNYSTKVLFLNDTILYYKSTSADSTSFGGLFANAGFQYQAKLNKTTWLKLGAYGQMKNTLNAKRDIVRETFDSDPSTGGDITVDSVYASRGQNGKIIYPASYGFGFSVEKEDQWSFGADYAIANWSDYRYYGSKDEVKDNWQLRLGGQFIPNIKSKSYWSIVSYRIGFYTGPDYIQLNEKLNQYAFTFGAGFPIRKFGAYSLYNNQFTIINTAVEVGSRGNKNSQVKESFFKISIGFTLSDRWFIKPKYN